MVLSGIYDIQYNHTDKFKNHYYRIDKELYDTLEEFIARTGHDYNCWHNYKNKYYLKSKSICDRNISKGKIDFVPWEHMEKTGIKCKIKTIEMKTIEEAVDRL